MKSPARSRYATSALICCCVASGAESADEETVVEAMAAIFEFSPYQGGNIRPRQIPREDWTKFHVVDTRSTVEFQNAHIPEAVNVEWRQVLARRDELPEDKPVLLYCNTGSLSAQAAFALKVAGREDVYILTGGFDSWNANGRFDAYSRFTQPSP